MSYALPFLTLLCIVNTIMYIDIDNSVMCLSEYKGSTFPKISIYTINTIMYKCIDRLVTCSLSKVLPFLRLLYY